MTESSLFVLASRLYQLNDQELATVLDDAEVGFAKRITDFYDLADEVLSERVWLAQRPQLSRYQLTILRLLAEHPEGFDEIELTSQLLVEYPTLSPDAARDAVLSLRGSVLLSEPNLAVELNDEKREQARLFTLWPEHADRVFSLWQELQLAPAPVAKDTRAENEAPRPLGSSYEYLHALTDLLQLIRTEPVKTKANGEPTETEYSRLQALMPPIMVSLLRPTLDTVANTRLIRRGSTALYTTAVAEEFLQQSTAEQWLRLAHFWVKLLPIELHHEINASAESEVRTFDEYLLWLYPQLGEHPTLFGTPAATLSKLGSVLGLLTARKPSATLRELIQNPDVLETSEANYEPGPEVSQMLASFPADSSGLYLQADLSAIAAGPIPNRLDFLLRDFADKEGLGIAPRYRFSADSLNRAWRRGLKPETLREALHTVAIAELPSSLNYLIDDTYQSFSSTTIKQVLQGTLVFSSDELRAKELAVDPRLSRFRWLNTPEGLFTQSDAQHVSEVLWEAGYPAKLELIDTHVSREAGTLATTDSQHGSGQEPKKRREQIALIRANSDAPDHTSWALKQLNAQLGSKKPLLFTVNLPQGVVTLKMIPLGIAAGRLRARDIEAESERTLPLSRVLSIDPIAE